MTSNMLDGLIGGIREVLENGRPIPFKRAINFVGMRVVQGVDWLSVELASLLGFPLSRTGDPQRGQVLGFDGHMWTNTDAIVGGGTDDHQALVNRDASDCHPASAILDTNQTNNLPVQVSVQQSLDTLRSEMASIPVLTEHSQLAGRNEFDSHPAEAISVFDWSGGIAIQETLQSYVSSLKGRIEYLENMLYPQISIELQQSGPFSPNQPVVIAVNSARVLRATLQTKSNSQLSWGDIMSTQGFAEPVDTVAIFLNPGDVYVNVRIVVQGAFNKVTSNEIRAFAA